MARDKVLYPLRHTRQAKTSGYIWVNIFGAFLWIEKRNYPKILQITPPRYATVERYLSTHEGRTCSSNKTQALICVKQHRTSHYEV
jgi:hypothetical protein